MIHIRAGDKTWCGRDFAELALAEPDGACVSLVTSVTGAQGDPYEPFDAIADQATCPNCKRAYWSTRPPSTYTVIRS